MENLLNRYGMIPKIKEFLQNVGSEKGKSQKGNIFPALVTGVDDRTASTMTARGTVKVKLPTIYTFEKTFRFISSITLVELADINSELLHTLADRAPGTFQHSMQVSNLAAEAAKTIGANALLVRTGALYHDIGKMADPLYYVENQNGEENPLLKMDPRDAAQVIMAHVTEGEKIARKNHLPEAVINFITTHHGTSLVRYFYNTYCNAHPNEQVDETLFRYPGAKPSHSSSSLAGVLFGRVEQAPISSMSAPSANAS